MKIYLYAVIATTLIDVVASYLILYYLFVERKYRRNRKDASANVGLKKMEKRITKKKFIILVIVSVAVQALWIILYNMWFEIIKMPNANLYKNEIGISILILRQTGYVGVVATVFGLLALWILRFKRKIGNSD